jgi:hypothetical protein
MIPLCSSLRQFDEFQLARSRRSVRGAYTHPKEKQWREGHSSIPLAFIATEGSVVFQ